MLKRFSLEVINGDAKDYMSSQMHLHVMLRYSRKSEVHPVNSQL